MAEQSSPPAATPSLPITGERYHPEILGEIRQEHLHRYAWAMQAVAGLDVADIASGEGFGSFMLSQQARSVVGVDVSAMAVAHSAERYRGQTLSFIHGDAADLPLADGSVDAVVSFETIEHVRDPEKAVAEIRRILRPSGFLIMSSPNRLVYSDRQGHTNEFHLKEFTVEEFRALLATHFPATRLFGQRLSVASSILDADDHEGHVADVFRDDARDTIAKSTREIPLTMYCVAIAAEHSHLLPPLSPSFLVTGGYDVYWQMRDELSHLRAANQHLTRREQAYAILASGMFSPSYYLSQSQGPWQDDVSLAIDYLETGEKAGLKPSPLFDPVHYLTNNVDVANTQMSPLMHYILHGRSEGRQPISSGAAPATDMPAEEDVPAAPEKQKRTES